MKTRIEPIVQKVYNQAMYEEGWEHGEDDRMEVSQATKELLELFSNEVESKMRLTKDGTNSPDDVVMTYRDWLELKQRIKGE